MYTVTYLIYSLLIALTASRAYPDRQDCYDYSYQECNDYEYCPKRCETTRVKHFKTWEWEPVTETITTVTEGVGSVPSIATGVAPDFGVRLAPAIQQVTFTASSVFTSYYLTSTQEVLGNVPVGTDTFFTRTTTSTEWVATTTPVTTIKAVVTSRKRFICTSKIITEKRTPSYGYPTQMPDYYSDGGRYDMYFKKRQLGYVEDGDECEGYGPVATPEPTY